MNTNILGKPIKFDASKTVWVLLAKDKTHVMPAVDGSGQPFWTYDEKEIDVIVHSMKGSRKTGRLMKYRGHYYHKATLATAVDLVGQKQAELVEMWNPVIEDLKKASNLTDRWNIYTKARKATKAHSLLHDEIIRKLLKV